jgi:hypothetical protein
VSTDSDKLQGCVAESEIHKEHGRQGDGNAKDRRARDPLAEQERGKDRRGNEICPLQGGVKDRRG